MNQNYHLLAKVSSAFAKNVRNGNEPPTESSGVTGSSWRCSLASVKPFSYLLLLFLLVFNVWDGHSQVGSYGFASSVGTYTPISGGTVLGTTANDEQVFNNSTTGATGPVTSTGFPIGFNFTYNGTSYDKFAVATNGYIVLGTGSFAIGNSTTTALSTTTTAGFANVISAFNQDMQGQTGSVLSYTLLGSSPNRTLVVEWLGYKRWNGTSPMNLNFQIRLNETSNTIEFVYGTMATVTTYTTQTGLRGATNAAYVNRSSTTSWATTSPGSSNSATLTLSSTVLPTSGTTYTWTPPVPCTGTPVAGSIDANTTQYLCSGATVASLSVNGYATGATGISFQWEQSTNGTDWANATGGTGATTTTYAPPSFGGTAIQYRMKTLCSGGGSSVTNVASINTMINPTTQVSAVSSAANPGNVVLTWTNGNGNRRVVLFSNAAITDPTNGSGPALTAAAAYTGSGQQIVYDGTGTTVTVTGLTTGSTYNVKVYEYTRCGSSAPYSYFYNTSTGTNAIAASPCSAISSLPWTEGFEGVTTATTVVGTSTGLPSCWNSQSTKWSSTTSTSSTNPRTGTKYIRYSWSTTNAFMWTPGFQLTAGTSYDFSFYAQGDGGSNWTNDVFVNTSQSSTSATQLTPTYVAPANTTYAKVIRSFTPATSGVYYFAIRGNQASSTPNYMAFDDFEVSETPNPNVAPPCTTTPSPATAVTGVQRNPILSWSASTQVTTSYDIYFGTSATPAFVGNQTAQSFTPVAPLLANTTYYWKVIAKNANGDSEGCSTWSFTTGANINYCVPASTDGCTDGDVIARVILNTLDNNSGTGCPSGVAGYSNYTTNPALTTTLQAGAVYSCTVYAGEYTEGYAAWIDYNDDGVFDNATERIGYSNGKVAGSGIAGTLGSSASFPIALACNPSVGTHRLRVRAMFNTNGIDVTPCTNNSYGEVEDYVITITEAAACPQPSALTATEITASGANLTWTLGCAESAWEVLLQNAGDAVPTAGSSGVAVTATTYAVSSLLPGHSYEYYVRANCGATDGNSLWTGPFVFSSLPSEAPQCVTIVAPANGATGIVLGTNQSYTLSWTPNGQAAASYDVYAGFAANALDLLGNTAQTTMNVTNMPTGTTIYWQIVPKNVVGSPTGCAVNSFTTTADPGDSCGTAISLATLTSPFTGTTADATNNYNPACDSSESSSKDKFYYIDVPSNYTLNIAQTSNSYDSVIFVGYGTCNAITTISCFDEPDTQATTWMNTTGATQTVYWIQDGYDDDSGAFTLAWSLTPPPACVPPSALTANVTNNTAVVTWTASDSNPANGYQYEVRSSGAAGSGNTGLVTGATVTGLQTNTITGLTIGSTYTIYVRSLCSDSESSSWASKAFLVPVPNDLCSNAVTLICGNATTGTTVGATNENMAVCGINDLTTQNSPGVWYKFTGDGSDVTISTCGPTQVDTRMAIYTGACGTLTCVAGNEDNAACTTATYSSETLLSTTPGTQYYVLVYAFSSSTAVSFNISMSCVVPCTPATANDECATAATVTVGTALASGNNCSTPTSGIAYPSCGSTFATYYDAWYTFNSGSNTLLEVALNNASTGTGFILYTGACGSLSAVSGSCVTTGAATNVTLTANTNYYIRVYTIGAANRGSYSVSVKVPCNRPTAVTSSAVAINTATIGWTAPTSGAPGEGYEYEVRTSGAAGSGVTGLAASGTTTATTVNLTGLAADTAHSVYVRAACSVGDYSPWTAVVTFTTLPTCPKPTAVTATNVAISTATIGWTAPSTVPSSGYVWEIRSSGAAGSGSNGLFATSTTTGTSVNITALSPLTTYSVYVRSSCDNGDLGAWTTAVTFKTKVANDICSGAIAVTCGSTVTGSTTDATNESVAVCGISGVTTQNTSGVWYKYVSNGTDVTFSTCSSTLTGDSRIAVFSGACGTLTCVGGNDDNDSCEDNDVSSEVVISNTIAGNTYYILVYAWTSNSLSFELTTTCAPACSPAANNNESMYAQTVQVGSVTATHNTCASASLGYTYPDCGTQFMTYYDTWYKFNSGANTSVIITSTATSPVVVGYAVYSGTPNALTQISNSCSTTGSATTVTGLTAHTVYYIRAFSTATAARGNFNLSITLPCNAPTGVTAMASATTADIHWTAAAPAPQNGYQYEVRTSGAAGSGATGLVASGNAATVNAAVSGLTANTTYSIYVRSVCDTGYYSSWTSAVTIFTGYCIPAPTSAVGTGITNVTFDVVNNTTAGETGNYADYTAMSGTGQRSQTVTVNVTHGTAAFTKIWVDWNNDMDFTDSGETVYTSSAAGTTAAATFTIPAGTSLGNHRMRVAGGAASSITACYTGANASYEDYTLTVSSVGPAHLLEAYCNATVTNFKQGIFSNTVHNGTAYRFRVVSQLGTQVIETPTPWFRLNMLTNYAYGVTYTVDVSVQVGGVWSDYGASCQVFTQATVPTTSLINCNATIDNFDTAIYANLVQGATTYRFKVVAPTGTYTLDRPNAYFKLNMLPFYSYGTTYTVSVDVLSGGVWSGYGSACTISSVNKLPSTQLRSADCGITVSNMAQGIYANIVSGAQTYNFIVTSSAGTNTISTSNPYFKLNQVPGYDYNEQYTVAVTVSAPGILTSDAGASCTVSSPATMPLTNLRSVDCGATIANRDVAVYCNLVPGAQIYRFRIVAASGTHIINRTASAYFKFNMLAPGAVASGETVVVSVMTISPNGTQSAYGSPCNVTLSSLSGRPGASTETNVSVKGYPNPFTATFTIDLTSDSEEMVDIVVYDMTGKLVETMKVESAQLPTLKLGGNLAAGVYNLIVTQGGTVKTIRVVKNVN